MRIPVVARTKPEASRCFNCTKPVLHAAVQPTFSREGGPEFSFTLKGDALSGFESLLSDWASGALESQVSASEVDVKELTGRFGECECAPSERHFGRLCGQR